VDEQAFQRYPGTAEAWAARGEADFRLAGKVEAILRCRPGHLTSLTRADRGGYLLLRANLAGLVERLVILADAATLAHERLTAALQDANDG
jgi:hypothetical protein